MAAKSGRTDAELLGFGRMLDASLTGSAWRSKAENSSSKLSLIEIDFGKFTVPDHHDREKIQYEVYPFYLHYQPKSVRL